MIMHMITALLLWIHTPRVIAVPPPPPPPEPASVATTPLPDARNPVNSAQSYYSSRSYPWDAQMGSSRDDDGGDVDSAYAETSPPLSVSAQEGAIARRGSRETDGTAALARPRKRSVGGSGGGYNLGSSGSAASVGPRSYAASFDSDDDDGRSDLSWDRRSFDAASVQGAHRHNDDAAAVPPRSVFRWRGVESPSTLSSTGLTVGTAHDRESTNVPSAKSAASRNGGGGGAETPQQHQQRTEGESPALSTRGSRSDSFDVDALDSILQGGATTTTRIANSVGDAPPTRRGSNQSTISCVSAGGTVSSSIDGGETADDVRARSGRNLSRTLLELVSSERVYLSHLYRLVNLYVLPLRGQDTGGAEASGASSARGHVPSTHAGAGNDGAVVFDITPVAPVKKGGTGAWSLRGSTVSPTTTASGLPLIHVAEPPSELGVSPARPSVMHDYAAVGSLLTLSEHERVFSSVEELVPLHVMLLGQLSSAIEGALGKQQQPQSAKATRTGEPPLSQPSPSGFSTLLSTSSASNLRLGGGGGGGATSTSAGKSSGWWQRSGGSSSSSSTTGCATGTTSSSNTGRPVSLPSSLDVSPLVRAATAAAAAAPEPSTPSHLIATAVPAVVAAVGRIFTDFSPFFKMYSRFCAGHGAGGEELRTALEGRPALRSFLQTASSDPASAGQDVFSLLAMPIQRVPRYVLLLRELVKHAQCVMEATPPYTALVRALELVLAAAGKLDAAVAATQNRVAVAAIQRRLRPSPSPSLVAPGREFVRWGAMAKVCRPFKLTEYVFFLFNDVLVYGSGPPGGGGNSSGMTASGGSSETTSSSGGSTAVIEGAGASGVTGGGGGASGGTASSRDISLQLATGPPIKLHQIIQLAGVEDYCASDASAPAAVAAGHESARDRADRHSSGSGGGGAHHSVSELLPFAFTVLGHPKSFIVVARSMADKKAWMASITACVDTLNRKRASFGAAAGHAHTIAAPITAVIPPAMLTQRCPVGSSSAQREGASSATGTIAGTGADAPESVASSSSRPVSAAWSAVSEPTNSSSVSSSSSGTLARAGGGGAAAVAGSNARSSGGGKPTDIAADARARERVQQQQQQQLFHGTLPSRSTSGVVRADEIAAANEYSALDSFVAAPRQSAAATAGGSNLGRGGAGAAASPAPGPGVHADQPSVGASSVAAAAAAAAAAKRGTASLPDIEPLQQSTVPRLRLPLSGSPRTASARFGKSAALPQHQQSPTAALTTRLSSETAASAAGGPRMGALTTGPARGAEFQPFTTSAASAASSGEDANAALWNSTVASGKLAPLKNAPGSAGPTAPAATVAQPWWVPPSVEQSRDPFAVKATVTAPFPATASGTLSSGVHATTATARSAQQAAPPAPADTRQRQQLAAQSAAPPAIGAADSAAAELLALLTGGAGTSPAPPAARQMALKTPAPSAADSQPQYTAAVPRPRLSDAATTGASATPPAVAPGAHTPSLSVGRGSVGSGDGGGGGRHARTASSALSSLSETSSGGGASSQGAGGEPDAFNRRLTSASVTSRMMSPLDFEPHIGSLQSGSAESTAAMGLFRAGPAPVAGTITAAAENSSSSSASALPNRLSLPPSLKPPAAQSSAVGVLASGPKVLGVPPSRAPSMSLSRPAPASSAAAAPADQDLVALLEAAAASTLRGKPDVAAAKTASAPGVDSSAPRTQAPAATGSAGNQSKRRLSTVRVDDPFADLLEHL